MAILIFVGKLLIILLAIIISLIVLLLAIPFDYYINLKYDQGIAANIKVLWARFIGVRGTYDNVGAFEAKFMIFKKEMVLKLKNNIKKKDIKKEKKEDSSTKKKRNKINMRELLDRGFLEQIFSYIKKVVAIIKPKVFNIKLVFGFDDPSITGCLSGFIYYLEAILPKGDFDIQPVFDQETIYLNMNVEGRITMGAILIQLIRLILRKDVRKKFKNLKKAETFS